MGRKLVVLNGGLFVSRTFAVKTWEGGGCIIIETIVITLLFRFRNNNNSENGIIIMIIVVIVVFYHFIHAVSKGKSLSPLLFLRVHIRPDVG